VVKGADEGDGVWPLLVAAAEEEQAAVVLLREERERAGIFEGVDYDAIATVSSSPSTALGSRRSQCIPGFFFWKRLACVRLRAYRSVRASCVYEIDI
jgi:hypothetical protein